jgi:alpha/beta superfamily hydrolase
VVLVGYSFGADIALGTIDGAIAGWFAIAPPFQFGSDWPVARDERPKALLVAALDQFAPPERARVLTSGWANTRVESVAGADHFLNGHGAAVAGAVTAWMGGV